MRIAIIDDNQADKDTLEQHLNRYAKENELNFDIDSYPCADDLLRQYHVYYDILIFDIDMPGTNGFEAARQIRQIDQNTIILFVTNIAQYAINGYEVDAIDYIIKPISYYDFALKFQKAIKRVGQRSDITIVLSTTEGLRKVKISDISYVEAMKHYLIYHVGTDVYTVRGNIKELEQNLRTYNFCQIHKSFLVNLEHIVNIKANELLLTGTALPIGRVYKDALLASYFDYFRAK